MLPFYDKTRLPLSPRIRHSHFSRTAGEICCQCGHSNRSATGLLHKFPQDAIDKKSSMCRRVSKAVKTHLGVDIAWSSLFDAVSHLRPPAPKPKTLLTKREAPFKFTSSTKVTKPSAILKTLSPTKKPSKTVPNNLKLHSRSIISGHVS